MHIKCSTCKGNKTIKGLGSVDKKCPECKGIGYVNRDSIPALEVKDNAPRRGRPSNSKSNAVVL